LPTKFIKLTLLLLGICVLSAAPVFADQTFTFTFTSPAGDLGTNSHTYLSGPLSLPVSGFSRSFFATNLFGKNAPPPNEKGLGFASHFAIDHEITDLPDAVASGTSSFVELNIGALLASIPAGQRLDDLIIRIGSLQGADSYNLIAGDAANVLGTESIVQGSKAPSFNVPAEDFFMSTCGSLGPSPCRFLNITPGGHGQSILLSEVDVVTTTTPEPSSAGLLLIGFGVLVAAGTLGKKLLA
jgi:hypothetical protein